VSGEFWRGDASAIESAPSARGLIAAAGPGRGLWPAAASQATLLLLIGIAFGPSGLAILTPSLLELIRPLVAVTLVVLGVVVAVESLSSVTISKGVPRLFSTVVVCGGIAASIAQPDTSRALLSLGYAALAAVSLAAAGWVLSPWGASDPERRIFSIATFLLIAGVADYLAVPALLVGWTAAVVWRPLRAASVGIVYLDAAYLQGPASALLLILAGAQVQFTWQVGALALLTAMLAFVGHRVLRQMYALASGLSVAPAVLVVALLMDATRLNPSVLGPLSVVVLATLVLQVLPRPSEARR
jgi:hypothetical protein